MNTRSQIPSWSCSRERLAPHQRPAVEKRAVAAVQVFDVVFAVDEEDAGVLAADRGGFQDDVALRVPPQGDRIAFQVEDLSGGEPL